MPDMSAWEKARVKCPWCEQMNGGRNIVKMDERATMENANMMEICNGCAMPYVVELERNGTARSRILTSEDMATIPDETKRDMRKFMEIIETDIEQRGEGK